VKNIPTNGIGVYGVTSAGDELFVLLHQDSDQVAIYSINDYQFLRHLNLPGLKPHKNNNLTSCVRYMCLFMSDYANGCIHRYDLANSATSEWSDGLCGSPCGLSVTPDCNLLIACQRPSKLVELSANSGECVREIALQADTVSPWHGIKLKSGDYVVCHGLSDNDLHRVCVVDNSGTVKCSYGNQNGPAVGNLNGPYGLGVLNVDEIRQFILAADFANGRVVFLSPMLEFVCCVSEGLSHAGPIRLYLHDTTRRLYVGQSQGDVVVYTV